MPPTPTPLAASLMLSVCCGACCLLSQLITSPQCARGLWGSHCRLPPGSNSKMQNRLRETSRKESWRKGNIFFGGGGVQGGQLFSLITWNGKSAASVNARLPNSVPHPSRRNPTSRVSQRRHAGRDVTHSGGGRGRGGGTLWDDLVP